MEHFTAISKRMQYLCFAYCEAKNPLWRMFFGWRKSYTIDGIDYCDFILSKKAIKQLTLYYDLM